MSTATIYEPGFTMSEARTRYFAVNGFGEDGGYGDRWVVLKAGSVPFFVFPNTQARVHALHYHDLHHVLTGYRTDLHGELEISAWELASGCRDKWAAWVINLVGMGMGMLRWPAALRRAFVRGRHSQNLYGHAFDEVLLARRVGELRTELGLDQPVPAATAEDVRAFRRYAAAGLATLVALLAPLAVLLVWALAVLV